VGWLVVLPAEPPQPSSNGENANTAMKKLNGFIARVVFNDRKQYTPPDNRGIV
jgi:hypothetical protein